MQAYLQTALDFFANLSQSFIEGSISLYDGIATGMSLDSIIRILIVYVFVIWAAFVIWVIKDITNRSTSLILQVFSILLVVALTPLFGLPIYLLIRPSTTLFERAYYAGDEDYDDEDESASATCACPRCSYITDEKFRYCPACGFECVFQCSACGERVREGRIPVRHCPHCGHERKMADNGTPSVSSPFIAPLPAATTDTSAPVVTAVVEPVMTLSEPTAELTKTTTAEPPMTDLFKFSGQDNKDDSAESKTII